MITMTDGSIEEGKKVPHMTLLYTILEYENTMRQFLIGLKDKYLSENEVTLLLHETLGGTIKKSTAKRYIGSLVTYKFIYSDRKGRYFLTDLSREYLNGEISYEDYILKCICRNLEWTYFLPDLFDIVSSHQPNINMSSFISTLKRHGYKIGNVDTVRRYLTEIMQVLQLANIVSYDNGKISLGQRDRSEVLSFAYSLRRDMLNLLRRVSRRKVSKHVLRKLYHLTVKAHLPSRNWRHQILKHQRDFDDFLQNQVIKIKEKKIERFKSKWQLKDPLYKWQESFLQKWLQQKKGIAKVITGAGKTHLAMAIIEEMKKVEPELTVTIVVPTIVLLEQWYDNLIEKLQISPTEIALKGGEYSDSFEGKKVFILVINSAIENNLIGKITQDLPANLLIVDECHKAGAPKFRLIFEARRKYTLGLSATPERERDDAFETILIKELGEIIGNYTYRDALNDGIIPKYNIYNYAVVLTGHEKKEYQKLSKEINKIMDALKYKYPQIAQNEANIYPVLMKLSNTKKDPLINTYFRKVKERKDLVYQAQNRKKLTKLIINKVLQKNTEQVEDITSPLSSITNTDKIILFHELISEINNLFLELNSNMVSIYHSGFPASLNRIGLKLYREGTTKVLLSAKALIEGVDIPATNIGVIMASSSSKIQRIQSFGRVLRKAKGKTQTKLFNIYVKNTTDERIFSKLDWDSLIGESNIEYRLWSEFGEIKLEKGFEKPQLIEVKPNSKEDTEKANFDSLVVGDQYPGDTTAKITLSFNSQGNLSILYPKELRSKIIIDSCPELWQVYKKYKPSGGRLLINEHKHLLVKIKVEKKYISIYLGKLEEYHCLAKLC